MDGNGHKTPPIEEKDFVAGVNVVDFGDIRVGRGLTRRPVTTCQHKRLSYDSKERRIWCRDCEQDVEAFDAFESLLNQVHDVEARLERREKEIDVAENHCLHLIAAKNIEKMWRSRHMVPTCPVCRHGILPEDFKNGHTGTVDRELAKRWRAKASKREE